MESKPATWSGSGRETCYLVDVGKLSKLEADLCSIKAIAESLRVVGIHINFVVGYIFTAEGTACYRIFPRDSLPLEERTVHCTDIEELDRCVREHVKQIPYHSHALSRDVEMTALLRQSRVDAFPNVTLDDYTTSIIGKNGYEGILLQPGDRVFFVVGSPYGPSYNDFHFAMIKENVIYGYGGDKTVTDLLDSNLRVEGSPYTDDQPPDVGTSVYPHMHIVRKYDLGPRETIQVVGRRFENSQCIVTVLIPSTQSSVDVRPTDLCRVHSAQRNYQRIGPFDFETLSRQTKGILVNLAAYNCGHSDDLRKRFQIPEESFRLECTFEIHHAADETISYATLPLDQMRESLLHTGADNRYCTLLQMNVVGSKDAILLTPTPPSGSSAYNSSDLDGQTYNIGSAKPNKAISKTIARRYNNASFIEQIFPKLQYYAVNLQQRGLLCPQIDGLHSAAEAALEAAADMSLNKPALDCHSFVSSNKAIFPFGVDRVPEPTEVACSTTHRLVAGPLVYPTKQSKDKLGKLQFDEAGNPVPAERVQVDTGILNPSLPDCIRSFARRDFPDSDSIKHMLCCEQAILCHMNLYQLAAYLRVRLGDLDNVPLEAFELLPQFQIKRNAPVAALFKDANTTVRCYPTSKKILEALVNVLERSSLDEMGSFEVTAVVLDGPSRQLSTGRIAHELTSVKTVSTLRPEHVLGLILMTSSQVQAFTDLFGAAASQQIRNYQHKLKMSALDFASLASNVSRNNPEFLDWARMAIFAVMPTIKIGNPEHFTRSFTTEKDAIEVMLPIYTTLCTRDGTDLQTALDHFIQQSNTYLESRMDVINTAAEELTALVEELGAMTTPKPENHTMTTLSNTLLSCSACLEGVSRSGTPWNYTDYATQRRHERCFECGPDSSGKKLNRVRYDFQQCKHQSPDGDQCQIVTCGAFRDPQGRCPKHTVQINSVYNDYRLLRMIASENKKLQIEQDSKLRKTPSHSLVLANYSSNHEITLCLPAVAFTSNLNKYAIVWAEQFIGKPALLALFLALDAGAVTNTTQRWKYDPEVIKPLLQQLGVPESDCDLLFRQGNTLTVTVESNYFVLSCEKQVCTQIRCFVDHPACQALCPLTADRATASVAMMEYTLEKHQPDIYKKYFVKACNELCSTRSKPEYTPDELQLFGQVRVALFHMLSGLDLMPRHRAALGFANVKELPNFESELTNAQLFPKIKTRSPQTQVPVHVYTAHKPGATGGDLEQAMREIRALIAQKKTELVDLRRKRYRLLAFLEKARNTMVSSLTQLAPEIKDLYVNKSETHSAQPVNDCSASVQSNDALQQSTGQLCVICYEPDEGALVNCENQHGSEVVYCHSCADLVAEQGVCPICRGDIE